jgi:hypothetical protein
MPRPSSPKWSRATATDVPTYAWADFRLSADFHLPELTPADPAPLAEEWVLRRSGGRLPIRPPRRWFHRWRQPDGSRWLSFARYPGGYVLRFAAMADFDVRPAARQIHGYCALTTPAHTFNHLLLDQVLPLVAGGPRRLALHASVIDVDGRAVAFLGASGRGKSTLAAALARRGYPVLSDDCCVLCRTAAGFEIAPTYPGLRLFPENMSGVFGDAGGLRLDVAHYTSKQRIIPEPIGPSFSHRPVPLGALYVIASHTGVAPGAGLRIEPRSRRDSVMEIVGVTFYLDVNDGARAGEGFALAAEAAGVCGVRALTFPWNLAALDGVAGAVIDDLRR